MLVCFLNILLVFPFVFPSFCLSFLFSGHETLKKLQKSHYWNILDSKLAVLVANFTGSRSTDMHGCQIYCFLGAAFRSIHLLVRKKTYILLPQ